MRYSGAVHGGESGKGTVDTTETTSNGKKMRGGVDAGPRNEQAGPRLPCRFLTCDFDF